MDNLHPRIDYARQQRICDDLRAGRLTHDQADSLIRASWPPCSCCGDTSVTVVGEAFYCFTCFEITWAQLRAALDEAAAAAGGSA